MTRAAKQAATLIKQGWISHAAMQRIEKRIKV